MPDFKFRQNCSYSEKRSFKVKSPIFLLLVLCLLPIQNAHAYLDPGTGSYIIQILIGVALGAGYVLKVYWGRVIGFFANLGNKKKASPEKDHSTKSKKKENDTRKPKSR